MRSSKPIPARSKSVVITGASTGLGRAAAIHLAEIGYRVFAGVRTDSSAVELSTLPPSTGELLPVLLDVTDAESIARAGRLVERECSESGLWAVVNNAGISINSPLECVPIDVLRMQLETNVIGTVALSQRFLPMLRASGGRIVNVSSGIANIALPYLGAYAAAQFAREGLSDALRREMRPLGVSVSVIQTGAVFTPLWDKMRRSADEILTAAAAEVVEAYRERFITSLNRSESLVQATSTTTADHARVVAAAVAAKRPKTRYRVGVDSWGSAVARRVMPDRMIDVLITLAPKVLANGASPPVRSREGASS